MQKYLRGQLWWSKSTYINEKDETSNHIQKGVRPVLIVSNDTGNKYSCTVQVVPCTSAEKTNLPTHCSLTINKVKNTFLCEQLTTIDKSELTSYIVTLDELEMKNIENCFQVAMGIQNKGVKKPANYTKISINLQKKNKKAFINQEDNNDEFGRNSNN